MTETLHLIEIFVDDHLMKVSSLHSLNTQRAFEYFRARVPDWNSTFSYRTRTFAALEASWIDLALHVWPLAVIVYYDQNLSIFLFGYRTRPSYIYSDSFKRCLPSNVYTNILHLLGCIAYRTFPRLYLVFG